MRKLYIILALFSLSYSNVPDYIPLDGLIAWYPFNGNADDNGPNNYDAGYHHVIWNADAHSSGVYFVKMIAGEFISTQKLMLVK